MKCSKARYLMQLYIDRQLPHGQSNELELHVVECLDCHAELERLEMVAGTIRSVHMVSEPENLTVQIMQRIALHPRRQPQPVFSLMRASLIETVTVVAMAAIATFICLLYEPGLRASLPFTNGHDGLSQTFRHLIDMIVSIHLQSLSWELWLLGGIVGVAITLVVVGEELRSSWLNDMRSPQIWQRLSSH